MLENAQLYLKRSEDAANVLMKNRKCVADGSTCQSVGKKFSGSKFALENKGMVARMS